MLLVLTRLVNLLSSSSVGVLWILASSSSEEDAETVATIVITLHATASSRTQAVSLVCYSLGGHSTMHTVKPG